MAWLYVPGVAPLNLDSRPPSPATALWLSLSGSHVQRHASWIGWKTRPWAKRLFGTTSQPSTAALGVESWISSLRDSRANRSPLPVSSEAWPTSATSGPPSPASLASAPQPGSIARTSPASSQLSLLMAEAPTNTSRATYRRWVTALRLASFQRRKLALLTFANGCSSWPTATGQDENTSQNGRMSHKGTTLTAASRQWSSPSPALASAIANDYAQGGEPLSRAATMWNAPSLGDQTGGHASRSGARQDEALLAGQARDWATPKAKDWKTDGFESDLSHQVISLSSRPGEPTSVPGESSSPNARTSPPLLNPTFVEWLMGWPIGWTDHGSPLPATEWSRWSRHMRSSLSALGWQFPETPN